MGTQPTRRAGLTRCERHRAIVEALRLRPRIPIKELAQSSGVSPMTIYRDVSYLVEAGAVRRTRGIISLVIDEQREADASFRIAQASDIRSQMGVEVAAMITPGAVVAVDDSTTCVWVLRALKNTPNLTIVTNSLLAVREAQVCPNVKIHLVGGEYVAWAESVEGPTALKGIRSFNPDIAIMSASAVDGIYARHPYRGPVAVKKAMLATAKRSVLMIDATKFERKAAYQFASLEEFSTVVVDGKTPAPLLARLRENVADLRVVHKRRV